MPATRRLGGFGAAALSLVLCAMAICLSSARAEATEYGIESAGADLSSARAGAHADLTLSFRLAVDSGGVPVAATRAFSFSLPPGLVANPTSVAQCRGSEFLTASWSSPTGGCPVGSQVGTIELTGVNNGQPLRLLEPLYELEPARAEAVAQFGFLAGPYPVVIDARLDPRDQSVTASLEGAPGGILLGSAAVTLWAVPADPSHDGERITPYEAANGGVPETPTHSRPSGMPLLPFLSNPTRCEGSLEVGFAASSYAQPDRTVRASASLPPITGCGALSFLPDVSFSPTSGAADAASGADVKISLPTAGLEDPGVLLGGAPRDAVVRLPAGLTVNPAVAEGLQGCAAADVGLGSATAAACPAASRIATAEALTPLLPKPLEGAVYLAAPASQGPSSAFLAYLVLEGQATAIKLPLRFDLDEATGRVTATFDELPQLPFATLVLRFPDGPRALFHTPSSCGSYRAEYQLDPWSGGLPREGSSEFALSRNCAPGSFSPRFSLQPANPRAGASSTLVLDLELGETGPGIAAASFELPAGVAADVAAVPPCPETLARTAACPAASRLGSLTAAVGDGRHPLWIPGPTDPPAPLFLAGPYAGAPFSLLAAVPSQVGPFTLGASVVRAPLRLDPRTLRAGLRLTGLPAILGGVPLSYRALRLVIDRPGAVRNPTSCAPLSSTGTVVSAKGEADALGTRFQAIDCAALPFRPRVSVRFSGGLGRGGHPSVGIHLSSRPGEANLSTAAFGLPAGELLDLHRLPSLCARGATEGCPANTRLGTVWLRSPLLRGPLRGPVYLREPGTGLPRLLVDLRGEGVHLVLHGHTAARGGSLRFEIAGLPDLPLSGAWLTLEGGRHGLIVNSETLCGRPRHAAATLRGQNGKPRRLAPRIRLRGHC
jgi:hypothetical protein